MSTILLILAIISGALAFAEKLFKKKYSTTISLIAFVVFITSTVLIFIVDIEKEKSISQFQTQLLDKNDEISKLNNEVANILTAYDSFCYVEISSLNDKMGHLRGYPIVIQKGNYSINDINVHISNSYKKPPKEYTLEEITKGDIFLKINSLYPNGSSLHPALNLEQTDSLKYSIAITTTTNSYHEVLMYRKINEEWVEALQVTKLVKKEGKDSRKIVYEKVNKNFPTNKINWN